MELLFMAFDEKDNEQNRSFYKKDHPLFLRSRIGEL